LSQQRNGGLDRELGGAGSGFLIDNPHVMAGTTCSIGVSIAVQDSYNAAADHNSNASRLERAVGETEDEKMGKSFFGA